MTTHPPAAGRVLVIRPGEDVDEAIRRFVQRHGGCPGVIFRPPADHEPAPSPKHKEQSR